MKDIVYADTKNNDFDKEKFESELKGAMSDFAYYLKTGDRSRFKSFKKSLSEWHELVDEVKKNEDK